MLKSRKHQCLGQLGMAKAVARSNFNFRLMWTLRIFPFCPSTLFVIVSLLLIPPPSRRASVGIDDGAQLYKVLHLLYFPQAFADTVNHHYLVFLLLSRGLESLTVCSNVTRLYLKVEKRVVSTANRMLSMFFLLMLIPNFFPSNASRIMSSLDGLNNIGDRMHQKSLPIENHSVKPTDVRTSDHWSP